jgi:mannose/fructose/N-acetylgalactosamine-specific phosphotransferase system component IID
LNALSFFEELCISIENGMACEKTAHDLFESVIITYYRVLESWISERRKEVYHPYSMYGNLKTVYEKWEKDKRWS